MYGMTLKGVFFLLGQYIYGGNCYFVNGPGEILRRIPSAGSITQGQNATPQQRMFHHPKVLPGQIGEKFPGVPGMVNMKASPLHTPSTKTCQPPAAVDEGGSKEPSARFQHPANLRHDLVRFLQNVQCVCNHHRVESLGCIGQVCSILNRKVQPG